MLDFCWCASFPLLNECLAGYLVCNKYCFCNSEGLLARRCTASVLLEIEREFSQGCVFTSFVLYLLLDFCWCASFSLLTNHVATHLTFNKSCYCNPEGSLARHLGDLILNFADH